MMMIRRDVNFETIAMEVEVVVKGDT